MKRLCFVCMCLLLIGTVSPAIADMDGIHILSEQYHVQGYYNTWDYTDESWHSDSYDLYSTDSSGLSCSIVYPYPSFAEAHSSAGRFFTDAYSGDTFNDPPDAWAFASASFSFQLEESGWLHSEFFNDGFPWSASATLSDSTTGIELLNIQFPDLEIQGVFFVYETHTYSLSLFAAGTQNDAAGAHALLSFTAVPEPSTLLLLGLGAVMLRIKHG